MDGKENGQSSSSKSNVTERTVSGRTVSTRGEQPLPYLSDETVHAVYSGEAKNGRHLVPVCTVDEENRATHQLFVLVSNLSDANGVPIKYYMYLPLRANGDVMEALRPLIHTGSPKDEEKGLRS